MKLESLRELYIDLIKDLYSAETQIIEALPQMEKAASNAELRAAFRRHLAQTKEHAQRLEEVAKALNIKPTGKKCKGMEGLIKEGQELLKEDAAHDVLDAGLIAAAQKIEHYEISGYGTLTAYAELLGEAKAQQLFQKTLNEEAKTDEELTALAMQQVNVEAME